MLQVPKTFLCPRIKQDHANKTVPKRLMLVVFFALPRHNRLRSNVPETWRRGKNWPVIHQYAKPIAKICIKPELERMPQ